MIYRLEFFIRISFIDINHIKKLVPFTINNYHIYDPNLLCANVS